MPRSNQPWQSLPLGDIAFINPGPGAGTLRAGSQTPFVSLADLEQTATDMNPQKTLVTDKPPSGSATFSAGDIILAKYTRHVPYGVPVRVSSDFEGEGLAAPDLYVIRARAPVSTNYLFHILRHPTTKHSLALSLSGSGRKFLSESALRNLFIPLPPPAEQRQMTALLDEIDEARRIIRELTGMLGDLVAATFIETFGDPAGNPRGWEQTLLGDLIQSVETGPQLRGSVGSQSSPYRGRPASGQEHGMIKPRAVYTGMFLPEENQAIVDSIPVPVGYTLAKGDLLFSPSGIREAVDQITLVEGNFPRIVLSPRVWRLRPRPGIPASFIKGLFTTESVRRQVRNNTGSRAYARQHIEKAALLSVAVFHPAPSLLRRFDAFYWACVEFRKRKEAAAAKLEQLYVAQLNQILSARRVQVRGADAALPAVVEAESTAAEGHPFVPPDRPIWRKLSGVQQMIWELSLSSENSFRVEDMGLRLYGRYGAHVNREQILNILNLLVSLGVIIKEGRQDIDRWRRPDPERDQQVTV